MDLSGTKELSNLVKNLPAVQETQEWSLGWEDPLKRKWQPIPVVLPGEFLQFIGSQSWIQLNNWHFCFQRVSDVSIALIFATFGGFALIL